MQKGFLHSGGRGGNHKKKYGDTVRTESKIRSVEIVVSIMDGSKENDKSPTDVPILSNGKAGEGEQPVPNANGIGEWSLVYSKKWTPTANLLKEDMNSIPIWVKLHDILIAAFTADGLNVMATKLGNLIMLDKYMSSMCLQSWGRMNYARALIDIKVDQELKNKMIIAISNVEDDEKKNGESSSGTKKNSKTNSPNPFDALNMIENDDDLGLNGGSSNSSKKVIHEAVDSAYVGDDEKQLNPCKSTFSSSSNVASKKVNDPVNNDSNDEVFKGYNETVTFMAFTGSNVNEAPKSGSERGHKNLYEPW
nr:hypothetical protein [Tanacetum cinerariifolium]